MSVPRLSLLALIAAFSPCIAPAQEATKAQDPPAAEKKEEPKRDPKSLEYEKAIKDLKKVEGALTFYQRKKEILLELPESQVGKQLYIQATLASGASAGLQAGDPLGYEAYVFRIEKGEDSISFVRPNTKFRWSKDNDLKLASERSLPEANLANFRIEQTDPEKKLLLVNVSSLFMGEVFKLSEVVATGMGGPYMLDSMRSAPDTVLSFAENAVVRMNLSYTAARGGGSPSLLELLGLGPGNFLEDSRNLPLKVSYNLWFPKKSDYVPRYADPRVGYFTTDYYSVDRFMDRNRQVQLIHRWNLKKKDPNAALSEPVKPIVWTLDPSIPAQYRDAVKRGILFWNRAFEGIGFKNAVQVQDAPNDPNYNHADGRYNVIRWTMSPEEAYAVALYTTDPFTGEIVNANVTMDANMPQFGLYEATDQVIPSATANARFEKALLRDTFTPGKAEQMLFAPAIRGASHECPEEVVGKLGVKKVRCSHSRELAREAAFGWHSLQSVPGAAINREKYVNDFIADVISHEVGHCLGLRHNFIASTHLTTAQMADPMLTSKQGYSASVMDYNPVNVMAVAKGKGDFYMPTLGPYDLWAIKYGYSQFRAEEPDAERFNLAQIAGQAGRPGLAYNTDENADSFDPFVVRFDAARDSLNYSVENMRMAKRVLNYAIRELPKPGQSFDLRTQLIQQSLNRVFREGRLSARFVGGVATRRLYKGDSQKPVIEPVDAATQRSAMRLIAENVLGTQSFALPTDVKLNMGLDPARESNAQWTADLRSQLARQQQLMVGLLLASDRLDRIAENAFKIEGSATPYTVNEHYRMLTGAVYSELGSGKSISAIRRDLQSTLLEGLMTQASARSGQLNNDARTQAQLEIKELNKRIAGQLGKPAGLDLPTMSHLAGMKDQIDRFQARQIAGPR